MVAATHDDAPGSGDGYLLRRTRDDGACAGCHAMLTHSSTNTDGDYGSWGTAWTCQTCHDSHGSQSIYLLADVVSGSRLDPMIVDFRNMNTGVEDYGLVKAVNMGTGPCEMCHTLTKNSDGSPRFRNSGEGDGGQHHTTNYTCHQAVAPITGWPEWL